MSLRVGSGLRGIAIGAVAASVLVASLLPCPAPRDAGARAAPAHGHASHARASEASGGGEHADCGHPTPSLQAPCQCGCADIPGADASLSRLPVSLLAAVGGVVSGSAPPAPRADCGAPPDAPREPIDHVPLPRLA
jgi:hypothetical protein